jgi:hypothetical protein
MLASVQVNSPVQSGGIHVMSSKQDKIDAAKAVYEKALLEAELQEQFETELGMPVSSVHLYKLYDRTASVRIKTYERYSSLKDHLATPSDILKLARKFPGVPFCRVRGGGTSSFWTRDYFDEQSMNGKTEGKLTDMIAPPTIHFSYDIVILEWVSDVPNIGRIEFHVDLPPCHSRVGFVATQYKGLGFVNETRENRIIQNCELRVAHNLKKLMRGDTLVGESVIQKYASGSDTAPSPFVLFWIDMDSDQTMNVEDVVRSIWPEVE